MKLRRGGWEQPFLGYTEDFELCHFAMSGNNDKEVEQCLFFSEIEVPSLFGVGGFLNEFRCWGVRKDDRD